MYLEYILYKATCCWQICIYFNYAWYKPPNLILALLILSLIPVQSMKNNFLYSGNIHTSSSILANIYYLGFYGTPSSFLATYTLLLQHTTTSPILSNGHTTSFFLPLVALAQKKSNRQK